MAFFTLRSILFLLVCQSLCLLFVVLPLSPLSICSSFVPLLRVFCLDFSLLCFVSPLTALLFFVATSSLVLTLMSCVLLLLSLFLLNVCKFATWQSRNDHHFRDIPPGTATVIIKVKTRVRFLLPLFFKRFKSTRDSVISIVNGVLAV